MYGVYEQYVALLRKISYSLYMINTSISENIYTVCIQNL